MHIYLFKWPKNPNIHAGSPCSRHLQHNCKDFAIVVVIIVVVSDVHCWLGLVWVLGGWFFWGLMFFCPRWSMAAAVAVARVQISASSANQVWVALA